MTEERRNDDGVITEWWRKEFGTISEEFRNKFEESDLETLEKMSKDIQPAKT